MQYLSLAEVLLLHRLVMEQGREKPLLRDLGALESAVAQPRQTFGSEELYPGLAAKAAALGFSLIQNHPFVDGNKRVGHAAMIAFLRLNVTKRLPVPGRPILRGLALTFPHALGNHGTKALVVRW